MTILDPSYSNRPSLPIAAKDLETEDFGMPVLLAIYRMLCFIEVVGIKFFVVACIPSLLIESLCLFKKVIVCFLQTISKI